MLGEFIAHCEDSLTAAAFTHLLHLPVEIFWRILRNACYTENLPDKPGELRSVDYWPHWNPDGTENGNFVEPDVFMRFADFDLIVEAKRWDNDTQCPEQWTRELIAYANEYGKQSVRVKMIALGGIHDTQDSEVVALYRNPKSDAVDAEAPREIRCSVHMCRWGRLLNECNRMERELAKLSFPSCQTDAQRRILSDLIDLFAWHGFQTGVWFAEIVPHLPRGLGHSIPTWSTQLQPRVQISQQNWLANRISELPSIALLAESYPNLFQF